MRTEDVGTYEMLWDCPFCGTPKLLGLTQRHCPNCGGAQDPNLRYYPSEEDKVAVEHHIYFGADLLCPACSTPQSARSQFCTGCGSPLEGAKQAVARSEQLAGAGQGFAGESAKDAQAEVRARRQALADQAQGKTQKPAGMSKGLKIGLIVGGVVLVAVAVALVLLLYKREVALTVDGHSWERTIAVEVYGPVSKSEWCDSMPSKAYGVSRTKEVRRHEKIQDGEECKTRRKDNRDGTFKEVKECKPKYKDKPIYDEKCRFKIDTWSVDRTEKASGNSKDPAPSWPDVSLKKEGNCKGCEREGEREETYTLHYVDTRNEETHDCDVPLDKWKSVEAGSKWKAEVGVVTTSLDCDSLSPAG